MAGPEKLFENKVKKFLSEQGCWYLKYWAGSQFTKSGIPDLLICCNGRFIAVEVKAENGVVAELQKWNIKNIQKAGGIAMVLYPSQFEDFKKLILEVKKNNVKNF